MMNFNKYLQKIYAIFKPEHFEVFKMCDTSSDVLLFALRRRDLDGEGPLDPWYTINKTSFKIEGFSPHMDLALFREALNNPIDI